MTIIRINIILLISIFCFQIRRNVVVNSFVILISFFSFNTAIAQPCSITLNGTYTVGTGGDFSTLTAAANAYNNSCINGPLTFLLINANYSVSETFPVVFNSNSNAGPNSRLTIKPATSVNATITGSLYSGALLRINGNYITIDGSNNGTKSKNLSITNNSLIEPRVVWFGSVGTNVVSNCTLKNCILTNGIQDKAVITISDGTVIANPGYFSNINIENNTIRKSYYGIYCKAVSVPLNGTGLNIISNDLASEGNNAIQFTGIFLEGVDGALIKDNVIGNFIGTDSASDNGIFLSTNVKNTNIINNKITNLNYTGGQGLGPHGIYVGTSVANANITIANNMIANISGDGNDYNSSVYTLENPVGILLNSSTAQGNIRIYHNSIYLGGTAGYTNTLNKSNAISACIRLRSGSTADIRNNILVNNLGLLSNSGLGAMCILISANSTQFEALDFNDYSVNPTGSGVKLFGHIYSTNIRASTLTEWKAATLKDVYSVNILPAFNSPTDLHLLTASNNTLNNLGTPITGYSTDIDNTNRNPMKPDIGCDEFVLSNTANWIGKVSDDWNLSSNWETNLIPNDTTDLNLTNGYPFFPHVTSLSKVRNLLLSVSGNNPLITIDTNAIFQVYGTIATTGGSIDGTKGTFACVGSGVQNIPAGIFRYNQLLNLSIGNSSSSGVFIDGPVDILRSITFTSNGLKLNTQDNITLKSTLTETAWVGDLTGKKITGNVTVERFIPTGINHTKSWQFIAVPLSGNQTINQAWQDTATAANQSRYAGYGTQITSAINPLPPLFDVYTPSGGTMKIFNSLNNSWVGVANTTSTPISNPKGYFIFVRGDRTVTTSSATALPTILRAKGKLYTATIGELPPVTTVSADKFESVGNPFASSIDFLSVVRSGNTDNVFYVWDPLLPGTRGLGGYQTISATNGYKPIPGGTLNYNSLTRNTKIQSGQAFFVHATGDNSGGTITFSEAAKISGSNTSFRPLENDNLIKGLSASLFTGSSNNDKIADGNMVSINANYSNLYTSDDALKINNSGENFGIICGDKTLSIEARNTAGINDTIFYSLSNLKKQNYQLRFKTMNLDSLNLTPYLIDKYNHSEYLISLADSSFVDFIVNDSAESAAANRFYIVFKPMLTLTVDFVSVTANKIENDKHIINWLVENQKDIVKYEVEHSSNGRLFERLIAISNGITNTASVGYSYIDSNPFNGDNFYRIKAESKDGMVQLSNIVKLSSNKLTPSIMIYSGVGNRNNSIEISIKNMIPGDYKFNIYNGMGQLIKSKIQSIISYTPQNIIKLPLQVPAGIYNLMIFVPSGELITKEILVQ